MILDTSLGLVLVQLIRCLVIVKGDIFKPCSCCLVSQSAVISDLCSGAGTVYAKAKPKSERDGNYVPKLNCLFDTEITGTGISISSD